MEDAAAAVIDDEEDDGMARFRDLREGVDIMQRCEVSHDRKRWPLSSFRDADGRGDIAIDAGEASLSEDGPPEKPGEEKLVRITDRHAIG